MEMLSDTRKGHRQNPFNMQSMQEQFIDKTSTEEMIGHINERYANHDSSLVRKLAYQAIFSIVNNNRKFGVTHPHWTKLHGQEGVLTQEERRELLNKTVYNPDSKNFRIGQSDEMVDMFKMEISRGGTSQLMTSFKHEFKELQASSFLLK